MTAYLELLRGALTASLYPESGWRRLIGGNGSGPKSLLAVILKRFNLSLVRIDPFDEKRRLDGEDWPLFGYTMIGHHRLENIEACLRSVVKENIPGDFVECGVWRGGGSMYARAVLNELQSDKIVWLCDSFQGMPDRTKDDMSDPKLDGVEYLAVGVDDVKTNFSRFALLDDSVRFVKGWFSESLPKSPIDRIAVLRLDGDYYSSTMDALKALYDKVSPGGYVIIDDYNAFVSCKKAVGDFIAERGITTQVKPIDNAAVYWRVG